jgi:DNA processing protein
MQKLARMNISVVASAGPGYPDLLAAIEDAPIVLYVRSGAQMPLAGLAKTIAVVGTRQITAYGIAVTRQLTQGLVSRGYTIVSGLAYGVDAVAHETAIRCGGNTIAVLGCGIDIIAPSGNARLYRTIAQSRGAVVSEMPLGHRPEKGVFIARNRIISGMSLGVVVTEGAADSGALITARNAASQGREVFAVPGPVTSQYSRAAAILLKNGATLVERVDDIFEEL